MHRTPAPRRLTRIVATLAGVLSIVLGVVAGSALIGGAQAGAVTVRHTSVHEDPSSIQFTSPAEAEVSVGQSVYLPVTTTDSAATISELGALPSGLVLEAIGSNYWVITGTITYYSQAGTYPLYLTAVDGGTQGSQDFTLTVDGATTITSADSAIFIGGAPGSFSITTNSSSTASLSESGPLPSGVTFYDNGDGTAELAGIPIAAGSFPITITADDFTDPIATQDFTLVVTEAPAFTSAADASFAEGSASSFTVTTSGSPAATISLTGSLPTGVSFVDNGDGTATISGTPGPGTSANYPLTLTAANGAGPDAEQSFDLAVGTAPTFISAATTTFTEGTPGDFTVATPGPPFAAYTEAGTLPSGVSFIDNGNGTAEISGTPSAGSWGTYPIVITADNGFGSPATQDFTLVVDGPPEFTSFGSGTFRVGTANSYAVTTAGSPTVSSITMTGALPAGLVFVDNGNGTGAVQGTPAAGTGGVYYVTLHATNGVAPDASMGFTVTVLADPVFTSVPATTFTATEAGSFAVTASGYPAPTFAVTSGTLPSGVTLASNGTLSGTPAAGTQGPYRFTITATDSPEHGPLGSVAHGGPVTANQVFNLTVLPAPVAGFPTVGGSRLAVTPTGQGYWEVNPSGAVVASGDAKFLGDASKIHLNAPMVGIASTPDGKGYWLIGSDGGVFAYGDAAYLGGTGNIHLNEPMVGITPSHDGKGYWMVASDGGIFAFGDAAYLGSPTASKVHIRLHAPIIGLSATPDGKGYWLIGSDGGVFTYGDSGFYGSTGNIALSKPIVGIATTITGHGYWLVAADGGVFAFGDAAYHGSTGGMALTSPIVGMFTDTGAGHAGYTLVQANGAAHKFGS